MPFTVDRRGYLYEAEYSEEELSIRRRNESTERGETSGETSDQTQVWERAQATWWCRCVNCNSMPTDPERYCCHEEVRGEEILNLVYNWMDIDVLGKRCVCGQKTFFCWPCLQQYNAHSWCSHIILLFLKVTHCWSSSAEGNRPTMHDAWDTHLASTSAVRLRRWSAVSRSLLLFTHAGSAAGSAAVFPHRVFHW